MKQKPIFCTNLPNNNRLHFYLLSNSLPLISSQVGSSQLFESIVSLYPDRHTQLSSFCLCPPRWRFVPLSADSNSWIDRGVQLVYWTIVSSLAWPTVGAFPLPLLRRAPKSSSRDKCLIQILSKTAATATTTTITTATGSAEVLAIRLIIMISLGFQIDLLVCKQQPKQNCLAD